MALKKKSKNEDEKALINMAEEYNDISKKMKLLDNTKKTLSEKIKEIVSKIGVKDSNGSQYFETDKYVLGRVAKKRVSLKEDKIIEYLEKNAPSLIDGIVKVQTVKTINEKALEEAVRSGKIPMEVFENEMCKIDVSYMVSVKEKSDDMPEVEQTRIAASKKR